MQLITTDSIKEDTYSDAKWLYLILALTNFPDNFRHIYTGALRGLLDTQIPMLLCVGQSVLNLGLAYLFLYETIYP